ncbi:DUF3857 domain-containing protein [Psychroserpens ponticola]|uniref:DUF3857 domain-containing protein n=1 Tax=Psychroserpens ponticola TaxID=2932268 RepID=A0ABY7S1T5_9FLAO|nr:DUF3857 domain-containing protein [Psychroserpens ponticola]WCO03340.1 DUF3857 domain-containing protein [Psychroserpens ponticola]
MIKKIALIALLISTTTGFAQYHLSYDWEKKPKLHKLTDDEKMESSVAILKKVIVEYNSEENSLQPKLYETKHTIIRVNDDNGISQHNTVYISMHNVKQLIDVKARTISPTGKVILLNKDNIKEVSNVEEYGDFKIFAIEGAEMNSEIEVLYTVEKEFDIYGSETVQANYKIKEAQFLFITGKLQSNVKAYRTLETFEAVKIDGNKGELLTITDIPAMIEEEYATPKANNIAVVYQCFPEGQNITQNMFWTNVSNNIGRQFFPETIASQAKDDVNAIVEGKTELNNFKKAALVDIFIKTNYTIVKNNNQELSDLNYILTNRSASDYGILKVYAQYLTALEVEFEIVITANRFLTKFDPEFFVPGMLQDFLIYIPSERKYIAPDRFEGRIGEAPFNILGNYGLFIASDFKHYFSKIIQEDPDYSRIRRDMNITFKNDFESVTIDQDQDYYGHWSETSRAVLSLSTEQGIAEYKDYLTGSGIEDKEIVSYETFNTDMNQLEYNIPFKVKTTIASEVLLEDVGDSYIFQIGLVIGTQSELYQETERINPIEMIYPNRYNYEIIVNIPEGYAVEGLESLIIDKRYIASNGKETAKFESNYKLENNKIIITIEEFYKTHEFDLNKYEEFREVINAASDFNKAAILFKAAE